MSIRIHINEYLVDEVVAEPHPTVDLVTLTVFEQGVGHRVDSSLSMAREFWQRAVDQLAGLGITPTVQGVEAYGCGHCGARFGIAGHSTGSPEDLAAEEQYRADVAFHESAACAVPSLAEVPC